MFKFITACFESPQSDIDLINGRALVTGGAQGIGRAVCEALMRRGCKVCCVDVNSEKGEATVEELQKSYEEKNCMFIKCDVSSLEEFEEAYLKAKESFGNLNVLVNNAGVADGNKIVDVNLNGVLHGCELAQKYMGKNFGGDGGVVVNVSSVAAFQLFPTLPAYCASKAGVVSLTRCYGHEENYASSKVKFTAICPCVVNTPLIQNTFNDDENMKNIKNRNPIMEPSELAESVIQLIEEGRNGAIAVAMKGKRKKYMKFSEKKYIK